MSLLILPLVLLGHVPANSAWVVEYLGQAQSESRSLVRPTAISTDPTREEICVTDAGSGSLQFFNRFGLDLFKTSGLSQLRQPMDAVVDAEGNIFFTDGSGGQIERSLQKLNWMGEPVEFEYEPAMEGWRPLHLALSPEGDLIAVDSTNLLLTRHSSVTGQMIWSTQPWDDRYRDENRGGDVVIGRPTVAPDGKIYVPISSYSLIMVFDADGELLDSFGTVGSRPGQMTFPVDVAIGPQGIVLVLDRSRHKLLLFDEDHDFVTEMLGFGRSAGRVYFPSCLSANEEGLIFVGQGFQGRVQIFHIFNTDQGSRETPDLEVGAVAPIPRVLRYASGIRQAIGVGTAAGRAKDVERTQGSVLDVLLNVGRRGISHASVSRSEVA